MLALFKKKCEFCRVRIAQNSEVKRSVKVPGYVGTFEKAFCCEDHAEMYEQELGNMTTNKSGGCC
ncbi:MAG: hypothetical protein WC613_03700 [Candidatus Aenigmatarchaeota archaeon]